MRISLNERRRQLFTEHDEITLLHVVLDDGLVRRVVCKGKRESESDFELKIGFILISRRNSLMLCVNSK